MKEFWIKLHRHENDDYNELWKTKDNEYFARHIYDGGTWYMVSDPLGYCELDYPCNDDYLFHICDSNYKELFTSTNADDSCNFPCLQEQLQTEWNKYKSSLQVKEENSTGNFYTLALTGVTNSSRDKWLLSFKDPELYGDKANDYDENWTMFRTEETKKIKLSKFQFVGEDYYITAVHMRHTICGAEWIDYYCAGQFMGAYFDSSKIGTMYSKRDALNKVEKALTEIYPDSKYHLSAVDIQSWGIYEKRLKFYQATERLLKGNYKRIFVDAIIAKERETHSFYTDIREIKKAYPDCKEDYNYTF